MLWIILRLQSPQQTGIALIFYQPLLFIAGLLAFAVAAIPEVWYRFCLQDLVYRRQLEERRIFFGETITLRLVTGNRKLLPLPWLEVEGEFPETLGLHGGRLEPHLIPYFGSPLEELLLREQAHLPLGTTVVVLSTAPAIARCSPIWQRVSSTSLLAANRGKMPSREFVPSTSASYARPRTRA